MTLKPIIAEVDLNKSRSAGSLVLREIILINVFKLKILKDLPAHEYVIVTAKLTL